MLGKLLQGIEQKVAGCVATTLPLYPTKMMNKTIETKVLFSILLILLLFGAYQGNSIPHAEAAWPPKTLTLEQAGTAEVCDAEPSLVWKTNENGLGFNVFLPIIQNGDGFLETFTSAPLSPTPWNSKNWDITVHARDEPFIYSLQPMNAQHGPKCEGPPLTHPINAYEDAVFSCNNHVMTAINDDGYGLIYLTPNAMIDFSKGEAVLRFDMSTLRTSLRDWVDIWITPFDHNLQLTLDYFYPDLTGEPRNSVHVFMSQFNEKTNFHADVIRNFQISHLPGIEYPGYEDFLDPSAMRRDIFELRISKTHIRFGMPADPGDGYPLQDFWWVDTSIFPPLDWDRGVVQFGHHSYNPLKDCTLPTCTPNTWHWDNVSISPAAPFTMIHADKRFVDHTVSNQVTFEAPSPQNAFLRFAGRGSKLQFSLNNGQSWFDAQLQDSSGNPKPEHFQSYWTPIPAGVTSILFKGLNWSGGVWHIRDISIWAEP